VEKVKMSSKLTIVFVIVFALSIGMIISDIVLSPGDRTNSADSGDGNDSDWGDNRSLAHPVVPGGG
jgi:hypothetical protein